MPGQGQSVPAALQDRSNWVFEAFAFDACLGVATFALVVRFVRTCGSHETAAQSAACRAWAALGSRVVPLALLVAAPIISLASDYSSWTVHLLDQSLILALSVIQLVAGTALAARRRGEGAAVRWAWSVALVSALPRLASSTAYGTVWERTSIWLIAGSGFLYLCATLTPPSALGGWDAADEERWDAASPFVEGTPPVVGLQGLRVLTGSARLLGLALLGWSLRGKLSAEAGASDPWSGWTVTQSCLLLLVSLLLPLPALVAACMSAPREDSTGSARLTHLAAGWASALVGTSGPGAVATVLLWALSADGAAPWPAGNDWGPWIAALPLASQSGVVAVVLVIGAVVLAVSEGSSACRTVLTAATTAVVGSAAVLLPLLPAARAAPFGGEPSADGGDDMPWAVVLVPALVLGIGAVVLLLLLDAAADSGVGAWRPLRFDAAVAAGYTVSAALAAAAVQLGLVLPHPGWSPPPRQCDGSALCDPLVIAAPALVAQATCLAADVVILSLHGLAACGALRLEPGSDGLDDDEGAAGWGAFLLLDDSLMANIAADVAMADAAGRFADGESVVYEAADDDAEDRALRAARAATRQHEGGAEAAARAEAELQLRQRLESLPHDWVWTVWLPQVGLPQLEGAFAAAGVTPLRLAAMHSHSDFSVLGVRSAFQRRSLRAGVAFLRRHGFDVRGQIAELRRERWVPRPALPDHLPAWTNRDVVAWLRQTIPLHPDKHGRQLERLCRNGLHGALLFRRKPFRPDDVIAGFGLTRASARPALVGRIERSLDALRATGASASIRTAHARPPTPPPSAMEREALAGDDGHGSQDDAGSHGAGRGSPPPALDEPGPGRRAAGPSSVGDTSASSAGSARMDSVVSAAAFANPWSREAMEVLPGAGAGAARELRFGSEGGGGEDDAPAPAPEPALPGVGARALTGLVA